MPHQSVPLGAHESVRPAAKWDHRMLHCNRLISSLPHSIPFHPDPFSVSCFGFASKYLWRKSLFLTVSIKHRVGQIWIFFVHVLCTHQNTLCIFMWRVSTGKARRAVNCGFMCPFPDRCLEGDRGLRRHQTTSVCCLCRCSSTTGFDYLLLLECEIWICFSITQSLVCVGAGRSVVECWQSWTEFVLVLASTCGWNVCALFRREWGGIHFLQFSNTFLKFTHSIVLPQTFKIKPNIHRCQQYLWFPF